MTSGGVVVPVDVLREAVRERVAVSSLRAIAEETGVSYTSLRWLLRGSEPYSGNVAKLTAWYLASVPGAAAAQALAVLLADVPAETRSQTEALIREAVANAYREAGHVVPGWIGRLMPR